MRPKTQKLVITFHTTAAAMAMEKLCHEQGLPGRLHHVIWLTFEQRRNGTTSAMRWCRWLVTVDEICKL